MSDAEDMEQTDLSLLVQNLSRQQPAESVVDSVDVTRCCCGQDDCHYFMRSQHMLAELEKDVHNAATLGQAILRNHESSMADWERERERMAMEIASAEAKSQDLELENSRTIAENRSLLAKLEDLNISMSRGENRARELQDDLDAVHAELARVSAQATRADTLDTQLAVLESEQEELRNLLATSKEEERSAIARCKKAERTLGELEQQIERMEREHELENARSRNLLERLEKRRLVDKKNEADPDVTPLAERTQLYRFMKEITAENGHLQEGITELRDMLLTSQEEVNLLREQLQMMSDQKVEHHRSPLSQELERTPSQTRTIVHHHHYHPEKAASKSQTRRPKKKRNPLAPDNVTPLGRRSTEILSTSPPTNPHRWSIQTKTSAGVSSSFPASSESSIFDRAYGQESSRPSSADSNYPPRPNYAKQRLHRRHSHNQSITTNGSAPPFTILHTTEEEEVPCEEDVPCICEEDVCPDANSHSPPSSPIAPLRKIHRAASHESLLSVMEAPSFQVSPALSSSSFTHRSHAFTSATNITNAAPQTKLTHGIVTLGPTGDYGASSAASTACNKLLGINPGTSPSKALSRKSSAGSIAGSWFWRWGGSVAAKGESDKDEDGKKRLRKKPSVLGGFVDEELLKDSLGEVMEVGGVAPWGPG
ncbi:hypothetical protein RUND412_007361 [Rhizina undulata]